MPWTSFARSSYWSICLQEHFTGYFQIRFFLFGKVRASQWHHPVPAPMKPLDFWTIASPPSSHLMKLSFPPSLILHSFTLLNGPSLYRVLLQQEIRHIKEARRIQMEEITEWESGWEGVIAVGWKLSIHHLFLFFFHNIVFSEPSQRPAIQDAGNRCVKTDLSGRGSPAPLYQRVVRPDWSGGSKYLLIMIYSFLWLVFLLKPLKTLF